MIVLKAIGAFFVKIWRWIKETAWVQPLLIVGAIFAIIFSIPYITDWVSSWGYGSTGAFFNSKKQTLEGEKDAKDSSYNTKADEITDHIDANITKINDIRDAKNIKDEELAKIDTQKYGEKFFLVYTASDCDGCDKAESGFKYLSEQWGSIYLPSDNRDFNFYSIFTNEKSSNDSDYSETTDDKTAFQRYLGRHLNFFNRTAYTLGKAPYKTNKGLDDTNYGYYEKPDPEKFVTPTILLVDYSKEAIAEERGGVSEVLFGLSGDTDAERANTLLKMWNHLDTSEEAKSNNEFSKVYRK